MGFIFIFLNGGWKKTLFPCHHPDFRFRVDQVPIIDPWLLQCSWHSTRRCDPTWRSCLVFGWCQRPQFRQFCSWPVQQDGTEVSDFSSAFYVDLSWDRGEIPWNAIALNANQAWEGSMMNFKKGRNPKTESLKRFLKPEKKIPDSINLSSILVVFFVAVFLWCWGNDGRLLPCLGLWLLRQASLYSAASHLVDSIWDLFVTSRKGWVEKGESWRDIPSQWEFTMWDDKNLQIVDLIVWELATNHEEFSSFQVNLSWFVKNDEFQRWPTGEMVFQIQEPLTHRTLMEAEQSAQSSVSTNGRWRGTARLLEICFGTREIFQFSCEHVMIQTDCVGW